MKLEQEFMIIQSYQDFTTVHHIVFSAVCNFVAFNNKHNAIQW